MPDNIEPSTLRILQHLIEARTILGTLSAANAGVVECLHNLPTPGLGDPGERADLVLNRLPIRLTRT